MVKNKRRALAVLIAVFTAFVVVAFFAHSSITTLLRHYHQDEESLTPATQLAWQLKHQEKLQELLRLETTSSKQMELVQQQVELLQQQNLQLLAGLKAANVPARKEQRSKPKELKSSVKSGPTKVHTLHTMCACNASELDTSVGPPSPVPALLQPHLTVRTAAGLAQHRKDWQLPKTLGTSRKREISIWSIWSVAAGFERFLSGDLLSVPRKSAV